MAEAAYGRDGKALFPLRYIANLFMKQTLEQLEINMMTQRIYFYGFTAHDYGRGSAIAVMLTLIIVIISLIQLVILRRREDIY